MDIQIEWQEPVQITRHKKPLFDESSAQQVVAGRPGVYFFSRKHGSAYSPFYIGHALSVSKRLRDHLKSAKIDRVLRGITGGDKQIKHGERYFHFGYLITRPGQDAKKCLRIVERYLVREALANNIPLLNKQLTKSPTHSISNIGTEKARSIYPKMASVSAN